MSGHAPASDHGTASRRGVRLLVAALAALSIFLYWSHVLERGQRLAARERRRARRRGARGAVKARENIGFVDQRRLDEHYAKHGAEFGRITKQDYLHQAQLLRDAEVGGPVLQTVRRRRRHHALRPPDRRLHRLQPQRHDPYLLQAA